MKWSGLKGASPQVLAETFFHPLFAHHTPISSRNDLQPHLLQEAFPDGTDWYQCFPGCASEYSVLASLIFPSQHFFPFHFFHCLMSTPYWALWGGRKHEPRHHPQNTRGLKKYLFKQKTEGHLTEILAHRLGSSIISSSGLEVGNSQAHHLVLVRGMKEPWTHGQRIR